MGFAWSHTTYAEWKGIIFNFEWKRDLDYFLSHNKEARRISSVEAWSKIHETHKEFIRIKCSDALGANSYRKKEVRRWYANKRNTI